VPLPTTLTVRLYTSHLLSTWNSRLFEFGAVLFLADIFPGSLLPLSIYALVRNAAAIVGAQTVGDAVDNAGRKGKRLGVVRLSVVAGRTSVVLSCVVCLLLCLRGNGSREWGLGTDVVTLGLFMMLVALACVEKLCSVMNLVAIERDWVVVMTQGNEDGRRSKCVRTSVQ
jgi:iron-regulated transporter 1